MTGGAMSNEPAHGGVADGGPTPRSALRNDEPVLRVERVSMHYGGLEALRSVTIEAHAGEVLGVVGDNGAGKSTLLRIIAGAQAPSAGSLILHGQARAFSNPLEAVEAGITTVYQDLALAMQRTVVDNFFLGRERIRDNWLGRRLGWLDRPSMTEKTKTDLIRLHARIPNVNAICKELSGGQRQALAIARAAAWCRSVLLLDEPTSALGVEQQREVLDLIRRVRDSGVAVILVSHQMPDVMRVCDRVTVLWHGEVAAHLTKDELTERTLVGYITGAHSGGDTASDWE